MNAPVGTEGPVVITLRDVYTAVTELDRKVSGAPARVEDHELRLRALEQRVWLAAGVSAGVSGMLTFLGSQFFTP